MNQKFDDFLARFVRVESGEKRAVFTAFARCSASWAATFQYGRFARPWARSLRAITSDTWIWTAVFAIAIIPVYGFLVARVSRATLVPAIYGSVAIALAATGLLADPQNMVVGRVFYVGISVINLFLISVFWSFLLSCSGASRPNGCSASSPRAVPPVHS